MTILKYCVLFCVVASVTAFFHSQPSVRVGSTALSMGWFNNANKAKSQKSADNKVTTKKKKNEDWIKNMFTTPVHGGGSANDEDLDDMYSAQQDMLAERRKHFDHKTLKSKYEKVGKDHLRDIPTIAHDPKMLNQKEDDVSADEAWSFETT